jgi:hypothetical protein
MLWGSEELNFSRVHVSILMEGKNFTSEGGREDREVAVLELPLMGSDLLQLAF